ncbi:hypothetical protein ACJJTC_009576 [Scirpophaga incertulas]
MPRYLTREERNQILIFHNQERNIMQISQELNVAIAFDFKMKGNSRAHRILNMANKVNTHGCNAQNVEMLDTNFVMTNTACSYDHPTSGVTRVDTSTCLQETSNLLDLDFQNITEAPSTTINIDNAEPTFGAVATVENSLDVQCGIDLVDLDNQNIISTPNSVTLNDDILCSPVPLFKELGDTNVTDVLEYEVTPLTSQAVTSSNNELNLNSCDNNSICTMDISHSNLILNCETGLFESAVTDSPHSNELSNSSVSIKDRRQLNQTLRLQGKSYESKLHTAADGSKISVRRPERKLKNVSCDHGSKAKSERSFLCGSVNEQARLDVFFYFWSLSSWEAKRSYIIGLVTVRTVTKRRKLSEAATETDKKRNNGIDCYLPRHDGVKVRVCRDFFLATLDIKKDSFTDWIMANKLTKKTVVVISDNTNESTRKTLKSDSVLKWLDVIPKVPSHYCRSSSSRIYVDDSLQSLTKMHAVYSEWCQENQFPAVQRKKFCEILEIQKISIFKPRKDQCDTCVSYKEGNLDEATYQTHILKKTEARDAKQRAISEASSEHCVVTMDLQSVQLCPKLLVSAQYYKQKLQVHIFTIYVNNNKDVIVYIWHEGDGGVTANEFITCILDFIQKRKVVAEQAFQSISADDSLMKNLCQHVMKIEKDYYEKMKTAVVKQVKIESRPMEKTHPKVRMKTFLAWNI